MLRNVLSLFYPRGCHACGKSLVLGEECICTFCLLHLPRTNFHTEHDNPLLRIFQGRVPIKTGTALFYYQKGCKVQQLIHQFKYKGYTEIGLYLGRMMGKELLASGFCQGIDWVLPVPLHPAKLHQRGFNQSELFARGISEATGIPLLADALVKITATTSQTRKSRFMRWQNVESVFALRDGQRLENCNLLLADDVITTGATMEAAIHKLLEVPGVKVWVVAIAMAAQQ